MRIAVFSIMIVAESLIGVSFLLTWIIPGFRIWPPPSRRSWQFYYFWILIIFCYLAFITLGILDWNSMIMSHWMRYPIGIILIIGGIGLLIWAIKSLSYVTSLGLGGEFIRTGPYRFTRNPQYLGFIILILGYSIVTNSFMVWMCGLIGAVLFGIAPLLEEPWLEDMYGESYRHYKRRVPRFLGTKNYRNDT